MDAWIELLQVWSAGGARGESDGVLSDGQSYVFAVYMAGDWWSLTTVSVEIHPEHGALFSTDGQANLDIAWEDVEWFTPIEQFDFPRPEDA